MTFEEALNECKKFEYVLVSYAYADTINQVLVDFYINYQHDVSFAIDEQAAIAKKRALLQQEITRIRAAFKSPEATKTLSGYTREWSVQETTSRWLNEGVIQVLDFLEGKIERPTSIPRIFLDRMNQRGPVLSLQEFYAHRFVE